MLNIEKPSGSKSKVFVKLRHQEIKDKKNVLHMREKLIQILYNMYTI